MAETDNEVVRLLGIRLRPIYRRPFILTEFESTILGSFVTKNKSTKLYL